LFVWEVVLLDDLMRALSIQITNAQDIWFWKHDVTRIFSAKLAYSVVELASKVDVVPPDCPNLSWGKC
jgi:hypothetical protein